MKGRCIREAVALPKKGHFPFAHGNGLRQVSRMGGRSLYTPDIQYETVSRRRLSRFFNTKEATYKLPRQSDKAFARF